MSLGYFCVTKHSKTNQAFIWFMTLWDGWINLLLLARLTQGFFCGSVVENPPAILELQETQVWSLGWKDSLQEDMAVHSNILAWTIPWTDKPGDTVHRVTKSQTWLKRLIMHTHKLANESLSVVGQVDDSADVSWSFSNVESQLAVSWFRKTLGLLWIQLIQLAHIPEAGA